MTAILTPETLTLFLYFVVPGIVAVKVYDLIVPTTRREASAAFLDALAYSFMILAVGFWPYLLLVTARAQLAGWLYYLLLFVLTLLLVFFVPAGLAVCYYRARTKGFLKDRVPDPTPTPWDWFFSGKGPGASLDAGTGKPVCYVRFHMKEGDDLGGYFGQYSLASSYPNAQQVYVEEAWRLHEDGSFAEPVASTVGAVVNLEECELVEFVAIELPSDGVESDDADGEADRQYNGNQE